MKKVVGLVCLLVCIMQYDLSAVVVEDGTEFSIANDFSGNDIVIYVDAKAMKDIIDIDKLYQHVAYDWRPCFVHKQNVLDLWDALCYARKKYCNGGDTVFLLLKDDEPRDHILIQSLNRIPICKIQKTFNLELVEKIEVAGPLYSNHLFK